MKRLGEKTALQATTAAVASSSPPLSSATSSPPLPSAFSDAARDAAKRIAASGRIARVSASDSSPATKSAATASRKAARACALTLAKIVDNILDEIRSGGAILYDGKKRSLRLTNRVFRDRIGAVDGGVEFLLACGFRRVGNPPTSVRLSRADESADRLEACRAVLGETSEAELGLKGLGGGGSGGCSVGGGSVGGSSVGGASVASTSTRRALAGRGGRPGAASTAEGNPPTTLSIPAKAKAGQGGFSVDEKASLAEALPAEAQDGKRGRGEADAEATECPLPIAENKIEGGGEGGGSPASGRRGDDRGAGEGRDRG